MTGRKVSEVTMVLHPLVAAKVDPINATDIMTEGAMGDAPHEESPRDATHG